MIDVSELQCRMLGELEELRDENIFSLLNTIFFDCSDTTSAPNVQAAVTGLVANGDLHIGTEAYDPRKKVVLFENADAVAFASRISEWLAYDEAKNEWTLARGDIKVDPIPLLVLTEQGLAAARRLLGSRGYRWWDITDKKH